MSSPILNPDGQPVDWNDTATWYCFDCGTQDTDSYSQFDGYIRCQNCTAKWGEHHLEIEEWR